ncbi:hypothetical protein [Campylobacter cuniculorum]|uniref:Uncharacterized protein n=2 Tax=Campylobacter cuniculorum TaxID=374106 RepID=A0A1W6BVE1_9BACT|nr:hypothetical protein [Campylobacter cuniculorum]ARJ56052.1 hypothetical protein CCUN_0400 [Campylobacter cuniculorum DSM 23162 = LMG 24588]QOR03553.1 hypothetical protein A0071_04885 [Campylobacter cuniculorum]
MTYSFTQPQKRSFFNLFAKLWLALFAFAVFFIMGIYFIYSIKIKLAQNSVNHKREEVVRIEEQIAQANKLYEILLEQSHMSKDFNKENQAIKESLRNLFSIVVKTDGITLDNVEQDKNSLKITGVSPTKEMFALLLETPLKSIFDETHTSYYQLSNGWYRFININTKQNLEENDER